MSPDLINGLFEGLAGLFVFDNCRALWRDKQVKGISATAVMFFAAWGAWNVFYYPMIGQWWSFLGGLVVVTGNLVWVSLLAWFHFRSNEDAPVSFEL